MLLIKGVMSLKNYETGIATTFNLVPGLTLVTADEYVVEYDQMFKRTVDRYHAGSCTI